MEVLYVEERQKLWMQNVPTQAPFICIWSWPSWKWVSICTGQVGLADNRFGHLDPEVIDVFNIHVVNFVSLSPSRNGLATPLYALFIYILYNREYLVNWLNAFR